MDVSRTVAAPAARVWEVLTDTALWPAWGPSVAEVDHDGRYLDGLTRGRVRTAVGVWVPFSVTDFEPGHRWAWKVLGVPATGHRVEALGPDRSRAVFEVPVLVAPYAAVCWVALGRIAELAERNAEG